MMMTLSMFAAAFAGCLGGDEEKEPWMLTVADDVDATFVTSDWDPIIPNLTANDGMCDAILSAMTITDARDLVVDFTRAYYTSAQGVIGASGSAAISDVSELNAAGTTIALQSGTTSDLYAADNLGSATIQAYAGWPEVMAAVGDGTADYAIGDAPVVALQGTLLTTFSPENFGIAIRDDADNELEDALNVAITAIVASGEYDAHIEAWFPGTSGTLVDTTTASTATAYPTPTEGSTLSAVLESGSLEFCSDTTYPPFEEMNAAGVPVGFDVDIGHAIADEIAEHYAGVADATVLGCTNMEATNYDANANLDDASCVVIESMKIGLLNPSTGPIAVYSGPFTVAANMAIADLNADGGNFELVEADSGCAGTVAATAAQTLVDAGVVGVAGAACSGATMAANAVLSANGVVQVSYASTSPALSDSTIYPGFWRVVSSDAVQGPAMADMVTAVVGMAGIPASALSPALLHMTNDYGSGLADSFEAAWGADNLCAKIGYADTQTDFSAEVAAVADAGCNAVVLASYSTDGAAILETMAAGGVAVPVFGADGIADSAFLEDFSVPAAANGVFATKPRAGASAGDFVQRCSDDANCASGIYTAETYDAVMMIGKAALHEDGQNMATHLNMEGTDYQGAAGVHTFDAAGDVPGAGYDICGFNALSSTDVYFTCRHYWTLDGGVQDASFAGMTVKLGFLNPSTGPIAAYSPGFSVSAGIAKEMMNIAGWSNGLQFEIVTVDSGCDATTATAAAQTLVSAGVVGVIGAACSGATMAANAVLSAAGIPMISYASTSPALSDSTLYPHFFRVVSSDALQGPALADTVTAGLSTNPALLHMTNDYGSGLADSFEASWGTDNLCIKSGYADTQTNFDDMVQAVVDAGCDSVVLISYATDGAALVEALSASAFTGAIYGGDGVAEEGLCATMTDQSICDGIIATKPGNAVPNERSVAFAALCNANEYCAAGIYTAEAFDAFIIMGYSVFAGASSPGVPLTSLIPAVGQGFVGASGIHTFDAVGDVSGNGYCVGTFNYDATSMALTFDCNRHWSETGGLVSA